MVVQEHGGALLPGGTPEGRLKGKRVIAEKRRARAERSEAVDDAMVGHVEKMSDIIADLVEQAAGEQHRCTNCGAMGPKVPKLKLKEATEVAAILMRARAPARQRRKQRWGHPGKSPLRAPGAPSAVLAAPLSPPE